MKVFSLAVIALLGSVSAMTIKDENLDVAHQWVHEIENLSEVQDHNKELNAAKKELELKELQEDTKKSLISAEESKQKQMFFEEQAAKTLESEQINHMRLKEDAAFAKKFGFEPTHFTITNE